MPVSENVRTSRRDPLPVSMSLRPILRLLTAGLLLACACFASARDYEETCDGDEVSWNLRANANVRMLAHRRNRFTLHGGTASENIEVLNESDKAALRLTHDVPACHPLDELTLSVWFRSNRDGAQLCGRVVFPHQVNPDTGKALTYLVRGDQYTQLGTWQKLECSGFLSKLQKDLPRLRQLLARKLGSKRMNFENAYIDQAVIDAQTGNGSTEYFLDELALGPLVEVEVRTSVKQAADELTDTQPGSDAEFRLDRLYVQGRPYFPRLIPYHGEPASDFARMHFNLLWIPDLHDYTLMAEMQRAGLRAIATPPHASSADGRMLTEEQASLAPFGPETAPILAWNLGTAVPASEGEAISLWADQIRNADQKFKRPLMADVAGNERAISRQIPMMGMSRHILHGPLSPRIYRQWLTEHKNVAQPGSLLWTWVQTQPDPETILPRGAEMHPVVVEPEQIRLQVYAALSAGYRGIGFFTSQSLDADEPGSLERKLMVAQLNMELELLEPWLATGTVQNHTPFSAVLPTGANTNQLSLGMPAGQEGRKKLYELLSERDIQLRRQSQMGRELDAAMIRTDYGLLLLPVWLSESGQFVPDQMDAHDATIVVHGVEESAAAWEITTTGIQSLDTKRVTGGHQITLRQFDMTSAVIFTSDRQLIERLRQKMNTLSQASAQVMLELAQAKLKRVIAVDKELHSLGVPQPDAIRLLAAAGGAINTANSYFRRGDYDACRKQACIALQSMRILQHAYWSDAVRDLYAPTASPHTLCFQTLPDHWRMISRFRISQPAGKEVLPGGDFEDFQYVVDQGWKREQQPVEGLRSVAELYPRPHKGKYSLRLAAVPEAGSDPPKVINERPVTVTSPGIPVQKGQLIYISGWVRVAGPSAGNLDGAMLYDSLAGSQLAQRWTTPTDWQQFGILREAINDDELKITLTLSGIGEILFDDLSVTLHEPPGLEQARPAAPPNKGTNPLQFIQSLPDRIPKLSILPPRPLTRPKAEGEAQKEQPSAGPPPRTAGDPQRAARTQPIQSQPAGSSPSRSARTQKTPQQATAPSAERR